MHAEVTLAPEPTSVRAARRFVTDALEELGLDEAAFSAALLVSELVTNAVLHARTPMTVVLRVTDEGVRVAVSDSSPAGLRRRQHGLESGTGRGLLLVDQMASAWGVDRHTSGKTVWFELDARPGTADRLEAFDDELAGSAG